MNVALIGDAMRQISAKLVTNNKSNKYMLVLDIGSHTQICDRPNQIDLQKSRCDVFVILQVKNF